MPSTITLKNVPDEVHARLREAAQAHHRSVNSEAIVCLEQVLMPKRKESVEEELASIREMRAGLTVWIGSNDELNELKKRRPPLIVVATNVLAYLGIPGPLTVQAEALRAADFAWCAPTLWRSELRNVLMGYVKRKQMTVAEAVVVQTRAERVMAGATTPFGREAVIRLAESSGCTTYDCEFVAASIELDALLYTADRQLLRAFPQRARPLGP